MGFRFTTNTWRAPLQLIDCWLPTQPPAPSRSMPPGQWLLQRFVKAGWLRRHACADNVDTPTSLQIHRQGQPRARIAPLDDLEPAKAASRRPMTHRKDGRLALSGRIDQVCAELDRLAALEQRLVQ
jgi:hypothetical protein